MYSLVTKPSLRAKICFKNTEQVPENFSGSTEGVMQGKILSPILFSIFVNDLEETFRNGRVRGINIDNHKDILLSKYVDDMVILCYLPVDTQRKLNLLHAYCKNNYLTANTSQIKILAFHKGTPQRNSKNFYYNNEKVLNKFCYLGIEFCSSGKYLEAVNLSIKRATLATGQR